MNQAATLAGFGGLMDLARRDGVDIRPTLLRVLVDLYVQSPLHSSEEDRQFTELVTRLAPVVDDATRAAARAKLAVYARTPAGVMALLGADIRSARASGGNVNGSALAARSAAATPAPTPIATSVNGAPTLPDVADAVAAMRSPVTPFPHRHPRDDAAASSPLPDASSSPAGSVPDAGAPARLRQTPPIRGDLRRLLIEATTAPPDPEPHAAAEETPTVPLTRLARAFMRADASERMLTLRNLNYSSLPKAAPIDADTAAAAALALDRAAAERDISRFARILEKALDLPAAAAEDIAYDTGGEPLICAAHALRMPRTVFSRIVLLLNPAIGSSVSRVFSLVTLFDNASEDIGLMMLASWRGRTAPLPRSAHRPVLFDDSHHHIRDEAAPTPVQAPQSGHGGDPAKTLPRMFGRKGS